VRADRLISILLLLQLRGQATTAELAKRLEVSHRTVHRDMDALTAAGVPVYAERGVRGGWRLLGDYRTDLTGLSEGEARALLLRQPDGLLSDLGLDDVAEGAFLKLTASLPTTFRQGAATLRERIIVEGRGPTDAVPDLPLILEGMEKGCTLRFAYRRGDGETRVRVAAPLGLVAKGNTWYLIAEIDETRRTYRVSRMSDTTVMDEPFTMPPDFSLRAYWAESRAAFKAELPRYDVVALIHEASLERLGLVGRFATVKQREPHSPGWVRAQIRFEVEDDAHAWALSMGARAVVMEPPELRERVRETLQEMLGTYGPD
jgi:predicted DNA-binding transcriptional regulator YafY